MYIFLKEQWIYLLAVIFYTAETQEIQDPANVAAMVGDDAVFDCQVSSEPDNFWWARSTGSDVGVTLIYTKNDGVVDDVEKYEVDENYILLIKNLQIVDAGAYQCGTGAISKLGTLVVVGTPQLKVVPDPLVDGEEGELNCTVDCGTKSPYSLKPEQIPKLQLLINGEDINAPITPETVIDGYHYRLHGSINATATSDYDGASFECHVYTEDPEFANGTEVFLNITHPVTMIEIDPPPEDYVSVGETLTCEADGNPEPTYIWQAESTPGPDETIHGKELKITEGMTTNGGSNNWTCTASNTFDGEKATATIAVQFTATGGNSNPSEAGGVEPWVIAISVLIPLLVIIIVAVVIFLVMGRKKKPAKEPIHMTEHDGSYPYAGRSQQVPLSMASSRPPAPTTPTYPIVNPYGSLPGKTSPGSGDLGIRYFGASGINPKSGYAPVSSDPRGAPGMGYMANGRSSAPSSGRSSPSMGYPAQVQSSSGAFV